MQTLFPALVLLLSAAEPSIQLGGNGQTIDVRGLSAAELQALAGWKADPEQWTRLLGVYVDRKEGKNPGDQPAVLGTQRVEGDLLRFQPRYPLVPGLGYRVIFDRKHLPGRKDPAAPTLVTVVMIPRPRVDPTTVVERVYPTAEELPENALKFYLHFSAPMSRGESYRHIQLLDAAGKPVVAPFLELGEELWDRQGQRFTLFLDPGRIKRGLKPREEQGPILQEGKTYTLVVEKSWQDAEDRPLKDSFRKSFRVGASVDKKVDVAAWKLQPPPAVGHQPLTVVFPAPLDHALLQRMIWVQGPDGQRVEGTIAVSKTETCWQLTPGKPWAAGAYHLTADKRLEDLAGNAIGWTFEVDVFGPIQKEIKTETVQRAFTIAAK